MSDFQTPAKSSGEPSGDLSLGNLRNNSSFSGGSPALPPPVNTPLQGPYAEGCRATVPDMGNVSFSMLEPSAIGVPVTVATPAKKVPSNNTLTTPSQSLSASPVVPVPVNTPICGLAQDFPTEVPPVVSPSQFSSPPAAAILSPSSNGAEGD
eukprot:TRINITY_DN5987_c0_g1_i1.p1 TRINITY_DN5987_c0_g1~~TRINITY_DN5987_c0_g1_i1.p1  ORF type:complete len:152 (+),score=17.26 TRINITY_DN5987_c0_g1_i1:97-552(+)